MSNGKMRIKMGPVEIEYEGSEDFLKKELLNLLKEVSTLHQASGLAPQEAHPLHTNPGHQHAATAIGSNTMSVTTVAAKIGVKSGPDLLVAAAARLTRSGSPTFARQKLLDEMKMATGFYKSTYRSNLSNYLVSLVKEGRLQETSKDTYSLSAAARNSIEAKLVG